MSRYLILGKYSIAGIKGASAGRTKKAVSIIRKNGGRVDAIYALIGEYDLALLADFPNNARLLKAVIALTKLTGIGFTSFPALTIQEFDKLIK